jgi:hypothetical protein
VARPPPPALSDCLRMVQHGYTPPMLTILLIIILLLLLTGGGFGYSRRGRRGL